jgi:hypothetical protein
MIDDLVFAPFVPQPYWEWRLASETDWHGKAAILELLIRHDEERFRPKLDALLKEAAASPEPAVRVGIARHPKVSPQLCETLANDKDPWVRSNLAGNPVAVRWKCVFLAHRTEP